ncbi:MAG: hypothetical protein ACLQUY_08210 [Ktedonobacterales bacterium]
MKMGRERTVLCWDVRMSLLNLQIEQVQAELAEVEMGYAVEPASTRQRAARLAARLAELHQQLHNLGPSPRARMG